MDTLLIAVSLLIYVNAVNMAHAAKVYPVVEEQLAGTFVADVREQLPKNLTHRQDLKFGFLRGYDKKGFFHINDTTGLITTAIKLDRESLCPREEINCYFDIPVITLPLHQFQIIPIKVELLDINDNAPQFPQRELLLEILESQPVGTKFQIPSAVDLDQIGSRASQIEYSLKSSSTKAGKDIPFVIINSVNAETQDVFLQLTAPLDRESRDFYAFSLQAKDQGNPALVGSIDVVVQVLDANDQRPNFDDPEYVVRVQENVPRGTRILKVHASDGDLGRNGELVYEISSMTSKLARDIFDIDSETGEIHLKSELDREVKDSHKVWVVARDKSPSPLEATALVTVNVDDLNDQPPLIDISYFPPEATAAFISEDAPVGSFVALIRLSDKDAGDNARVVCFLQSDTFGLKQQQDDTYAIVTTKLLDREKREEYLLELTARDHGKPSLESRTTIQIVVGDFNDNPPVFDRSVYTVKVKENSPLGMELVQLRTSDKDAAAENQAVQFRLLEPSALFNLDEKRGVLYVQSQLDRETLGDNITVHVQAFDPTNSALPQSQVPVMIEIVDENDNSPEWTSSSFEFDISSDVKTGVVVGSVEATDVDGGNNGLVTYSLNSSDFIVNATSGDIITAHDILVNDPKQIQLQLIAKDGAGRSSTAQLFITIANATSNQLTHSLGGAGNFMDFILKSTTGLSVIIALVVVSFLLLCGAVVCVVAFRRKSKDDTNYNVRMETARAFERAKLGSKSQLNGGGSAGSQTETDSCHRRSMESEEKYPHWVYGASQTPPVSSSTKSSRCSSANTNRNSLLNEYGKPINTNVSPMMYDVVNEEATCPPGKTIQTFQLASQLQKTLDHGDSNINGQTSEEDDDGGFKRRSVVRASSFMNSSKQLLSAPHPQRCVSSIPGRAISPRYVTLPRRGTLQLAPPVESGYESSTISKGSNTSFVPFTIRPNPFEAQNLDTHNVIKSPLSRMTKTCIDQCEIPPTQTSKTPADMPRLETALSSPFSSSLNMSTHSGNVSSLGAGLEFDDEFVQGTFSSPFSLGTTTPPRPLFHLVEYHTPC